MKRWMGVLATLGAVALIAGGAQGHKTPGSNSNAGEFAEFKHNPRMQPAASEDITDDFQVVGHVRFKGTSPEGDVDFARFGGKGFAFVGDFGFPCNNMGVRIVNVSDPSDPKLIGYAKGRFGGDYQDVKALKIGARRVLAAGVQQCSSHPRQGLILFDVSQPKHPEVLSFTRITQGVHELDIVERQDGTVLALLAANFSEPVGGEGDLYIYDVTKPKHPKKLSDWGVINDSPLRVAAASDPPEVMPEITEPSQGLGAAPDVFGHSVRAADDGQTAYLSYWDAGELKLDITDPSDPQLVGRTSFPFDADGNAHSMTPYEVGGVRYVLQNDEDFAHVSPPHITTSATGERIFSGTELLWMPTALAAAGTTSGELLDAGDGCQGSDYQGAQNKIVLVDQDGATPCSAGEQILQAAGNNAKALVINSQNRPNTFIGIDRFDEVLESAGSLPVVGVGTIDGLATAVRSAPGTVTVVLDPQPPAEGYLRVFDESQAQDTDGDGVPEYPQVATFLDLPYVSGDLEFPAGSWAIHNTEVLGDRAYVSWYSHGIVALDISDPLQPQLVGQVVRPSDRRLFAVEGLIGSGKFALTWGVDVDPETGLVYASDMRNGLWIFRPTGDAVPSTS